MGCQYSSGGDLCRYVREHRRLSEQEACRLFVQVLHAALCSYGLFCMLLRSRFVLRWCTMLLASPDRGTALSGDAESGTETVLCATRSCRGSSTATCQGSSTALVPLSAYAHATECPVLTERMVLALSCCACATDWSVLRGRMVLPGREAGQPPHRRGEEHQGRSAYASDV
eukprot:3829303-Rhodomonas_salina.3